MPEDYSNRELDVMFKEIQDTLGRIEKQTMRTNGRVTKLENTSLVVGCILGTIAVIYFPAIITAIKLFI